eukprot:TRINITY_DN28611_c0_g1_i1.p1 TRINITY_DN28611_c0_g1~~TRINITY_DN28611_c0_g1_i1.p1  ORF type:complete len:110 (+),score=57.72 TRINITY_DN28611_c0_g1_i1:1-330(+)
MYRLSLFFLMIRRPPRSTQSRSSAASDVYKRQVLVRVCEGHRPQVPEEREEEAPEGWCELMRRCWDHRPSSRPKFSEIKEQLQAISTMAEGNEAVRLSLIHISEPTRPY